MTVIHLPIQSSEESMTRVLSIIPVYLAIIRNLVGKVCGWNSLGRTSFSERKQYICHCIIERFMEERNDIVIYKSEDGLVKMEALVDPVNETIWANQKAIAALFGVTVPNISYHLGRIFRSGELEADAVVKEFLITAQSGARGTSEEKIRYYNLDAIISIAPLWTETNASQPHSSFGSCRTTESFIAPMDQSASLTLLWSHLP